MPLDPTRPGFYKTIQCRYFDDNGRPLSPYCKMGSRCNYIHPEDSQWERRKKKMGRDTRPTSVSPDYSRSHHRDQDIDHRRGRSLERRSAAVDRPHSRERSKYERPPPTEPSGYRHASAQPSTNQDRDHRDHHHTRQENQYSQASAASQARPVTHAPSSVDSSLLQEKIAESLKTIASITNRYMLDNAVLDKEQEKLETYNNLSATLAKVSPSSVAAIAPTLASVISSHSKQRQAVQDDVRELATVWEDFMALFVETASRRIDAKIDAKVDAAVMRIRDEADIQAQRIVRMRASLPTNGEREPQTPARPAVTAAPTPAPAVDALQKRKYEDEQPRRWEERTPYRANYARDQPRYAREPDRSPDEKRARVGEVPEAPPSTRAYPSDLHPRNGDGVHSSYSSAPRAPLAHTSPARNTHHVSEGQSSKAPMDVDTKDQSSFLKITSSSGGNAGLSTNNGGYRSEQNQSQAYADGY